MKVRVGSGGRSGGNPIAANRGGLSECRTELNMSIDVAGGVDEVAEAEREELRRDNFGNPVADEQDRADRYDGTITHVDFNQTYNILRFQLDNGSVWEAKSSGSLRYGFFQPGEKVTIEKGVLGTLRLSIAGKRGWRGVKRID